jgi:hypothetical protein
MWIGAANTIQLISIGIIPLPALLYSRDLEHFLLYAGCGLCVVNTLTIAAICWISPAATSRQHLAAAAGLFKYGARRVPGDLAYYGLLASPAIAAAYYVDVRAGGEVAYGMAWVTLIGQLVSPLSMLLLPEASYLFQCGETELVRRRLIRLLAYSVAITCCVVGLLSHTATSLISAHLGSCTPTLLYHVRLLLVAAIPINVFICLRSTIDAGAARAVSPTICIGALVTFACIFPPAFSQSHSSGAVVFAFVVAVSVLALGSAISTWFVLRNCEAAAVSQQTTLSSNWVASG